MFKDSVLSGGVTTDICIYPLTNGNLIEKFSLEKQVKLRHVPSFEMQEQISLDAKEYESD